MMIVFSITFELISQVNKMHEMLEGISGSHFKHKLEILEDIIVRYFCHLYGNIPCIADATML